MRHNVATPDSQADGATALSSDWVVVAGFIVSLFLIVSVELT